MALNTRNRPTLTSKSFSQTECSDTEENHSASV